MSDTSTLDHLERDVERARARLADDLARLRDPQTIQHAKEDLIAQANAYKDDMIAKVRDAATERAQSFTDLVRQRAEENPAAVAAIGAGIAWHLWKHPPITTLLVGAGLASLFAGRGDESRDPDDSAMGRIQNVNRMTHQAGERAAELAAQARERALELADQARQTAAEWSDRARETASDLAGQTRELTDQTTASMTDVAGRTAYAVSDFAEDRREQIRENPVAMGLAALAIGAAFGIAMKRRA